MSENGKPAGGWGWERALHGIVPPLISPLDDSGAPDAGTMAALVEHVIDGGCTGLFMLGGCGEGAWLTPGQRGAVVRSAARAAAGRVPVLAGVMLPATGPAIEAARQAAGEGADALVVSSPYYFGVEPAAQQRHVEAVIAATALPALLYNIPQCTHHVLPPETVRALARDARVLGIKDSAGDFEAFQKLLAIKEERPRFRVLQGHESLAAASLLQGADGMVPGLANVAPALFVDLQAAVDRGAAADCARLQRRIAALAGLYRQGPFLSALKAACEMRGLGNGRPAPPLLPASPAERAAIRALLEGAGLALAASAAPAR
ncbi:MAG TPA: dihydrodipicolinate synthase family protein [Candidatus Nitrosotalea sp.]|jgi:4-hydroxy-tetrahydrodipicolinate synthase|nr:dihydrodipicolinate synthase family protein [Candidatus Nitrosotalea sp.]